MPDGAVACQAGVAPCRMPTCAAARGERCDEAVGFCVGAAGQTSKPCGPTCLDRVDCEVDERPYDPNPETPFVALPRCPRALFVEPQLPVDACGASCPCWRIVPRPNACTATLGVTPFALQIMRSQPAAPGTIARLRCRVATQPWSDPAIQQASRHCVLP